MIKPDHDHASAHIGSMFKGALLGMFVPLLLMLLLGYGRAWHTKVDQHIACHTTTHEAQVEVPDYCIMPTPTVEVEE